MNSAWLGLVPALTWGIGQLVTTLGLTLSGFIVLSIYGWWHDVLLPSGTRQVFLCAIAGGAHALATLTLFAAYRLGSMSIVSQIRPAYEGLSQ